MVDLVGIVPGPQDHEPTCRVWVAARLHDIVRDRFRRVGPGALSPLDGTYPLELSDVPGESDPAAAGVAHARDR